MNEAEMTHGHALIPATSALPSLEVAARIADQAVSHHKLAAYHEGLSAETLRRQKSDLALFTRFLVASTKTLPGDLYNDLDAWRDISHGLLDLFKTWQKEQGYALSSITVRLATLKAYCQLAHSAGIIETDAYMRIKDVKGYKGLAARNVDQAREVKRIGTKKEQWVSISPSHAELLKRAPSGPLAARDRLLLCLLLDHALRISEAALLPTTALNLKEATLRYERHKTGLEQYDDLTPDTLDAARRYLATIPATQPVLFRGVTARALAYRVNMYGKQLGLDHFSPHDCRHFFAEDAIRNGTDLKTLRDAGGWKTLEMPARYAGRQKIANQGIKLSATEKRPRGGTS